MKLRYAITEYSRWMVALAIRLERNPVFILEYTICGTQLNEAMRAWLGELMDKEL